jgi:hypothetical protein
MDRKRSCRSWILALASALAFAGALHAEDAHPILDDLVAQVGTPSPDADADGRLGDCSGYSIDYLDAHAPRYNAEHSDWAGLVLFRSREVPVGDGYCLYLEKPERLGLTREQALAVRSAPTMTLSGRFALPSTSAQCVLTDERLEESLLPFVAKARIDEGIGYRVGAALVDFSGDPGYAPLADAQRRFYREQLDEMKARPFAPFVPRAPPLPDPTQQLETVDPERNADDPPPPPLGTNVAGLGFEAHRLGAFASLKAEWNSGVMGDSHPWYQHHRYWLLFIPEKRIVTFDDLFADPDTARTMIAAAARTNLRQRWESMLVNGRTEAERAAERATLEARIARATSTEAAREWEVSLDLFGRCKPGLLVTMEFVDPAIGERAAISLEISARIAAALRPQYVAAFRAIGAP